MSPFDVHVITHTHWDREWYLPAGRFRQRLVDLIDALLDRPPEQGSVLLDGQAVLLDDYLEVRPERRETLAARLRDGSIEAGPWYVLADELMPSGESLVRNLLAGRRTLERLGAVPPPVLYSPDAFGHPAALPLIAQGFGMPLIVLWRGLGGEAWPAGDTVRWRAFDGSEALVVHLPPSGYEQASSLPPDEPALARWWRAARAELGERARTGMLLLLNGADHHAPPRGLGRTLATLERVAAPDVVHRSSLGAYATAVTRRAAEREIPTIEGELRHSYGYTWTLQGTLGTRAHLKRRHAHIERLLVRRAEPFAALAARSGGRSRAALLHAAWRTLLLCEPHDTLCGCSADEVARAMSARLDDAETQADGLLEDALLDLVRHDRVAARGASHGWKNAVLVSNPVARPRGGVAELELMLFRRHVPVGPGSADAWATRPPDAPSYEVFVDGGRVGLQVLERRTIHHRVESPEHYPDDDLVDAIRAVGWVEPVAGYGVELLRVTTEPPSVAQHPTPQVVGRGRTLENEHLRLEIAADGTPRLTSLADGRGLEPLVHVEDVGDAGDLYTHSAVSPQVVAARAARVELVHPGPLRAELRSWWTLDVPRSSDRAGRSSDRVRLEIELSFTLDAGARHLGVSIRGTNEARDHRLRIAFASGIANGDVHADAAFGVVRRERITASPEAVRMEQPPPTAPLHRYVTVSDQSSGMTLVSDGLAEVEVASDGAIAVTLVRAVGELSRIDLPERPGNAGWPVATPEAQSLGPFAARFAILPHGPRTEQTIADIERSADDVLLPVAGRALRSALHVPAPFGGVELLGDGLAVSACTESEDGAWLVLRCVNLLDRAVEGAWRLGVPCRDASLARLDETPLERLPVRDGTVTFTAPPRGPVTVLVR
jgi:alpha-mannosidase